MFCVNQAAAVPAPKCVSVGFVFFPLIPESERSAVDLSGLESEPDPRNEAATRGRLKVRKHTNVTKSSTRHRHHHHHPHLF